MDIYEENVDTDLTKQLDSKFRYCYAKYFDVFGTFGVTSNVILHCPKTPFGEYLVPCLSVSIIFVPRGQSFTTFMTDLCRDINRVECLHLAGALMEHFIEGIAPLRQCFIH